MNFFQLGEVVLLVFSIFFNSAKSHTSETPGEQTSRTRGFRRRLLFWSCSAATRGTMLLS